MQEMKEAKQHPNPAGRHGKPIILPPTTFEDAVKRIVTATPPPKEAKRKKAQASKKR